MKNKLVFLAAILVVAVSLTASARKPDQKTVRPHFDISVPVADPEYNKDGNLATAADTPIYDNNAGLCDHLNAVIAPDGHHVTLAEWMQTEGTAQAKCDQKGTH